MKINYLLACSISSKIFEITFSSLYKTQAVEILITHLCLMIKEKHTLN